MNPNLDIHSPVDRSARQAPTRLLKALGGPFPILFGLMLCWTLATPIFGVPDEPTQVIKAAAVAHGKLVGGPPWARTPQCRLRPESSEPTTRVSSINGQCRPAASRHWRELACRRQHHLRRAVSAALYALVGWPTLLARAIWPST